MWKIFYIVMLLAHAEPPQELLLINELFYAAAKRYTHFTMPRVQIALGFQKTHDGDFAGICFKHGSRPPKVELSEETWMKTDRWQREQLVFHELGHCVLNRNHDNKTVLGIQKSVMNHAVLPKDMYLLHREYYLRELFMNVTEVPTLDIVPPTIIYVPRGQQHEEED